MKNLKLCEICDVRDGTHDSPSYYSEGYPFITTKNLVNGSIDFSTASLICEKDYQHFDKRSHVDDGDILMPMIGTIGGAIRVKKDRDFAIKNVALIKKKNENIDFDFLLNVLNSNRMKSFFEQYKTGGTQKFISLSFIRNLPIPDISLEKQKEIASILKKIQSAINNKKQQLALLDEAVKSEFVEMFGENPVESGKWKVETLGDVCSSIVRGPFGSALKKDFFVPKSTDTVKVYEQKHAIQKSANIGTYYITNEKYNELKRFECKSGDFLMSCSGTMGEFYQLPDGCEKGIINQALCKFTLNNKLNSIMFLEWMKHSISNLETKGSGIKNVAAVSFVKQMPMFIPPKNLQEKYATFVQQIDKSKFVIKQQIADLQELLDSKMQEYFGE